MIFDCPMSAYTSLGFLVSISRLERLKRVLRVRPSPRVRRACLSRVLAALRRLYFMIIRAVSCGYAVFVLVTALHLLLITYKGSIHDHL